MTGSLRDFNGGSGPCMVLVRNGVPLSTPAVQTERVPPGKPLNAAQRAKRDRDINRVGYQRNPVFTPARPERVKPCVEGKQHKWEKHGLGRARCSACTVTASGKWAR